ncbi:MAG: GntR family transcriptional regulator, transcriptional repressor for pyruvate dehydrogenase complex [Betaproteobacteria bacterium]|jgi:GntR family transcriptional repressor for pyruvate dehydrogenase complex|nr:GntR family transcriptional regulator, transcriptional repressor for pyruvate dehydrogenase complex [Betaproteobacteria bacterium]
MAVHPLFVGRSETFASRIVADVREALFERRIRPGEFLGTEKDLAARHGVSRIVARDALRTLEALGIVDISRGAGGGARVTRGNPQLFAEALAVQLELADIDREEIMTAQGAIEGLAAELAARRASADEVLHLGQLVDEAEGLLDDLDAFTRSSLQFHLGVAEASHNRVLHYQLISLQHVSWPTRNRTLNRAVARKILDAHRRLVALIEARDAAGARQFMEAHVGMIRERRVAESKTSVCC